MCQLFNKGAHIAKLANTYQPNRSRKGQQAPKPQKFIPSVSTMSMEGIETPADDITQLSIPSSSTVGTERVATPFVEIITSHSTSAPSLLQDTTSA